SAVRLLAGGAGRDPDGDARSPPGALGPGRAVDLGAGGLDRPAPSVAPRPQALRRVPRLLRYLRLFLVQRRASVQVTMQYRAEFFVGAFMALFYVFWNLVPMFVLWNQRPTIAGWSLEEAALVTAWFTLLRALLDGAVQPSLQAVVEHIRKGTLDFV